MMEYWWKLVAQWYCWKEWLIDLEKEEYLWEEEALLGGES